MAINIQSLLFPHDQLLDSHFYQTSRVHFQSRLALHSRVHCALFFNGDKFRVIRLEFSYVAHSKRVWSLVKCFIYGNSKQVRG